MNRRFSTLAAIAFAATLPIFANGCGVDNPASALCCTDFKVGADLSNADFGVDASIKGSFDAFAQASSDLSGTASGMLQDVVGACQGIAMDLGATQDEQNTAGAATGSSAADAWCTLAVNHITAALQGSISIDFEPPKCEVSVSAQASCDAKCNVGASCDVNATPPTCTGGTLEVSCSGSCQGSATAPSIDCTGSCSGSCSGSCTAMGGVAVDCTGKCEGTCAAGGTANGTGVQADGSCSGTCQGTCTAKATAPAVKCSGSCSGKCDLMCSATPGQANFSCSGTCMGKATPLSCKGGTLKASCMVDANCDANCSASASAKADCSPPSVTVTTTVPALGATLEANLPKLLVAVEARGANFTAQLQAVGTAGGTIVADPGKLGVKGVACGVAMAQAVVDATDNASAAVTAGLKVTASVNIAPPG